MSEKDQFRYDLENSKQLKIKKLEAENEKLREALKQVDVRLSRGGQINILSASVIIQETLEESE